MSGISNIKKGDTVIVHPTYEPPYKDVVTEVTKTIIKVGHLRFKKQTGENYGGGFGNFAYCISTEGEKERVINERKNLSTADKVFCINDFSIHITYGNADSIATKHRKYKKTIDLIYSAILEATKEKS